MDPLSANNNANHQRRFIDFWEGIPDGAVDIVKHIAATELLQHLLGGGRTNSVRMQKKDPLLLSSLSLRDQSTMIGDDSDDDDDDDARLACHPFSSSVVVLADFDAIFQLVQQCPAICQEKFLFVGKDGQPRDLHPLAVICTLKPTMQIVQAIYEAYPQAVSVQEASRGSLPLHYAAAYEAPVQVLEFLVSKYRHGLKIRLTENISPLDLACYHFTNDQVSSPNINFLLNADPTAAAECCTEQQWYPLHSAVSSGATLGTVIRALYKAHSDAASSLGWGRVSPLHIAAKRKNYASVTEFLVHKSAAEILTLEDHEGHTPLTLAAMHQTARVIASLVSRIPEGARQQGHRGWSLVHLAAVHNCNETTDAVTYLAKRFPDQLTSITWPCRSTPLHLACRKGASLDNIKTLARLNRSVLHITDGFGKTPYDLALRRSGTDPQSKAVIKFLQDFEANPMMRC